MINYTDNEQLLIDKINVILDNIECDIPISVKIEKESKFNFKASSDLELFEIRSPLKLSYSTYYQRFN